MNLGFVGDTKEENSVSLNNCAWITTFMEQEGLLDLEDFSNSHASLKPSENPSKNPSDTTHFPIVVLISGQGSNLEAIIKAIELKQCPAEIKAVISNEPDAYGLEIAKNAHLKTHLIPHKSYSNRETFEIALKECIDRYAPKLIILAGFMRILSPFFIQQYPSRILNIHPALLPKYKGLNTHQRVLEARDKEHGVTIHIVTEALDEGPILAQGKIQVLEQETLKSLQARIKRLEHYLYPKVITLLTRGKHHENERSFSISF